MSLAPACFGALLLAACPTQTIVFPDTGLVPAVDEDGDGHGPPEDCDDGDATVYPGADEVCDEQDNDCDGLEDGQDPSLIGGGAYYEDQDGDGYGDPDVVEIRCALPDGWVRESGDCDDGDAAVNPGENERCNEVDDNCNGAIDGQDPTLEDGTNWCQDSDVDGYGDPKTVEYRCSQPRGYVDDCTDCDDGDPEVGPCE